MTHYYFLSVGQRMLKETMLDLVLFLSCILAEEVLIFILIFMFYLLKNLSISWVTKRKFISFLSKDLKNLLCILFYLELIKLFKLQQEDFKYIKSQYIFIITKKRLIHFCPNRFFKFCYYNLI